MFPDQMRSFNKRFINRITRHFVNLSRGPFAVIRHVGRRSGKTYETPIFVFPVEDGFVIALTYGPGVDWYRNVLAAGSCTLLWHRKVYALGKPEPATVSTVISAFPLLIRLILRLAGVRQFVYLKWRFCHDSSTKPLA